MFIRKTITLSIIFLLLSASYAMAWHHRTEEDLPDVFLDFYPPIVNFYIVDFKQQYLGGVTPIGGTLGLNFKFSSRNFLNVELMAVDAFPLNILDEESTQPTFTKTVQQINFCEHTMFRKFDVGYGVYLGRHSADGYTYDVNNGTPYQNFHEHISYASFGGAFSLSLHLARRLCLGITYYPQLISYEPKNIKAKYAQLISFGLFFRGYQGHSHRYHR